MMQLQQPGIVGNIDRYTRIVTEGANYVATDFSWDSAGYFWSSENLNSVVDGLRSGNSNDVDSVTDVVNRHDSSDARERRRGFYIETVDVIN